MTRLTDDALGDLLTETFAGHEHLADPERAVAIAAGPRRARHPGRLLLGAAAAVALVAAGTAYLVSSGPGPVVHESGPPPTPHPSTTPGKPPLPPLRTNEENRAAAARAAEEAVARLSGYPGAQETDAAGAPGLKGWGATISGPKAYTVTRQRWWTVTGTTAAAVANWYDDHAPVGFHSMGVGGEGDGKTWVSTVDFYPPSGQQLPPTGVSIEVQTLDTERGVEVRATVDSVWPPARPAASFVQDVSSIDVRVVRTRLNATPHHRVRHFTVSTPGWVLRVAKVFDSLEGYPTFVHSCPAIMSYTSYRIVFHTATGDVTARYLTSACSFGMEVRRDGAVVHPDLAGGDLVITQLGIGR